ncbi:MAG: UPF0755 protein [Planctomycetota bacterium]|jgi:UPF0755 protein
MYLPENYLQQKKKGSNERSLAARLALFVVLGFGILAWLLVSMSIAPKDFADDTRVEIPEGLTVMAAAESLEEHSVIRSKVVLVSIMRFLKLDGSLVAGTYRFREAPTVLHVAKRLSRGEYGEDRVRVTLNEGITRADMAAILDEKLERFDTQEFMLRTEADEGYLFPDTYFFFPQAKTAEVVDTLKKAFIEIETEFTEEVIKSGHSWHEIVTMASIIQREAYGSRDSYMISGILWNRIRKGIPLQVDAPFVYILGRGSAKLTKADLKFDSPYNTYVYKGLPPGPIGNPGRLSIKSALRPKSSSYLFYLHDRNGGIHYAETFDGHKSNKRSFLRK